jgi:dTDP-4-amino-4,6-dideoxygalactose transaminase
MKEHGVSTALGVSSGKAALTVILKALGTLSPRRKVIIPAYTCYSVPSAIVKAGLDVVPCDLAPDSFDYDYDQLTPMLGPDVLCVLSVDLFGIPSDTPRVRAACRHDGIFVIEDAAQALGSRIGGERLGTRGDVGFFSLGRGKNVTCGSGGIIVTRDPRIGGALQAVAGPLPASTFGDDVATLVSLLTVSTFLSPGLFWIPSGLPFLKLGETIFHEDFPVRQLSNVQGALLRDWSSAAEALNVTRRRNSTYYAANVTGARAYAGDGACLRFPVVLPGGAEKRRLLEEQDGRLLGISGMYPTSVGAIPQLQGRLCRTRFDRAERLAESLVTLPTHPMVSDKDRQRISVAVNAAMGHIEMRRAEPLSGALPHAGINS